MLARVVRPAAPRAVVLSEPTIALPNHPYNILITGVGGSGVITVGAILGMAAHLEGRAISVLDMTGMSQKNGAVTSHIPHRQRRHAVARSAHCCRRDRFCCWPTT